MLPDSSWWISWSLLALPNVDMMQWIKIYHWTYLMFSFDFRMLFILQAVYHMNHAMAVKFPLELLVPTHLDCTATAAKHHKESEYYFTCKLLQADQSKLAMTILRRQLSSENNKEKMNDLWTDLVSESDREDLDEGRMSMDTFSTKKDIKKSSWAPVHEEICKKVCNHCRLVAPLRVAALCEGHCSWNGRMYRVCFTMWSLIEQSLSWREKDKEFTSLVDKVIWVKQIKCFIHGTRILIFITAMITNKRKTMS